MKQKGLRYIEKGEQYCFGQKVPVFLRNFSCWTLEVFLCPPFANNIFGEKLLADLGYLPPPLPHLRTKSAKQYLTGSLLVSDVIVIMLKKL